MLERSFNQLSHSAGPPPLLLIHDHFYIGLGLGIALPQNALTSEPGNLQASAAPSYYLSDKRKLHTEKEKNQYHDLLSEKGCLKITASPEGKGSFRCFRDQQSSSSLKPCLAQACAPQPPC